MTLKELPAPIAKLLAAAGSPADGKIPLAMVDQVFAKMNLSIKQRLAFKAELRHYGVISA
jgi:hypothetical protein